MNYHSELYESPSAKTAKRAKKPLRPGAANGPLPALFVVMVGVVALLFFASSSTMSEQVELARGAGLYEKHMQKRGFQARIEGRSNGLGTAIPVLIPGLRLSVFQ